MGTELTHSVTPGALSGVFELCLLLLWDQHRLVLCTVQVCGKYETLHCMSVAMYVAFSASLGRQNWLPLFRLLKCTYLCLPCIHCCCTDDLSASFRVDLAWPNFWDSAQDLPVVWNNTRSPCLSITILFFLGCNSSFTHMCVISSISLFPIQKQWLLVSCVVARTKTCFNMFLLSD